MDGLTIGQVAERAEVHKETIRYYQGLGLLEEPPRRPGSIRRYGEAAVARLRFIKRAQQLGFSLEEVKRLLLLEDGQDCAQTRKLAEQKLQVIRARIADLQRMSRMLAGLVAECRRGKRPRGCPIIRTLSDFDGPLE
ncbi:MAG TPA: MerR family DNA-binding protein [Usitatibacter sp.]|nr:MerR family DNA-binding protein [Usitatibacter sp.]